MKNQVFTPKEEDLNTKVFTPEEEKIILAILRRMFDFDIELIESDWDEQGIPKDDPKRNEMSLRINPSSIPFDIPTNVLEELKIFFKEKGWEFVKITLSPSIKLKKIQPKS